MNTFNKVVLKGFMFRGFKAVRYEISSEIEHLKLKIIFSNRFHFIKLYNSKYLFLPGI